MLALGMIIWVELLSNGKYPLLILLPQVASLAALSWTSWASNRHWYLVLCLSQLKARRTTVTASLTTNGSVLLLRHDSIVVPTNWRIPCSIWFLAVSSAVLALVVGMLPNREQSCHSLLRASAGNTLPYGLSPEISDNWWEVQSSELSKQTETWSRTINTFWSSSLSKNYQKGVEGVVIQETYLAFVIIECLAWAQSPTFIEPLTK
jgi:hypothetical protein